MSYITQLTQKSNHTKIQPPSLTEPLWENVSFNLGPSGWIRLSLPSYPVLSSPALEQTAEDTYTTMKTNNKGIRIGQREPVDILDMRIQGLKQEARHSGFCESVTSPGPAPNLISLLARNYMSKVQITSHMSRPLGQE